MLKESEHRMQVINEGRGLYGQNCPIPYAGGQQLGHLLPTSHSSGDGSLIYLFSGLSFSGALRGHRKTS